MKYNRKRILKAIQREQDRLISQFAECHPCSQEYRQLQAARDQLSQTFKAIYRPLDS